MCSIRDIWELPRASVCNPQSYALRRGTPRSEIFGPLRTVDSFDAQQRYHFKELREQPVFDEPGNWKNPGCCQLRLRIMPCANG